MQTQSTIANTCPAAVASAVTVEKGSSRWPIWHELAGILLCWAKRCNIGVGGASALMSTTRWVCSHVQQRDEPFSNVEHEAVPRGELRRAAA